MCEIETASTFEEAKKLLETKKFDLTILDIMGVNGYALLEIANEKKITAVMLTAHALSPEEVVKSHEKGASYYIPKDRMADIGSFLTEILEAEEKGKNTWWRWLERLGSYFENAFGSDWQKKEEKFWNSFPCVVKCNFLSGSFVFDKSYMFNFQIDSHPKLTFHINVILRWVS